MISEFLFIISLLTNFEKPSRANNLSYPGNTFLRKTALFPGHDGEAMSGIAIYSPNLGRMSPVPQDCFPCMHICTSYFCFPVFPKSVNESIMNRTYPCHDRYDKYCNRADEKIKYELDKTKGKERQINENRKM